MRSKKILVSPPTIVIEGSPPRNVSAYRLGRDLALYCDGVKIYVYLARWDRLNHYLLSSLAHFLFGFIFNILPIHSAGVMKNGDVVLLVGPAGSGKTTAYKLAESSSFEVLHDDLNIVEIPSLKVWSAYDQEKHPSGKLKGIIFLSNLEKDSLTTGERVALLSRALFFPSFIETERMMIEASSRMLELAVKLATTKKLKFAMVRMRNAERSIQAASRILK